MTKLSGSLPKDAEHNGMHAIERSLIAAEDGDEFTLLVRVETAFLKVNKHTGESEPLLAILDVQPVLPGDVDVADRLLRAARQAHSGQSELEIDGLTVTKGTGEVIDGPWHAHEIDGPTGVVRVPADDAMFREPVLDDEDDEPDDDDGGGVS